MADEESLKKDSWLISAFAEDLDQDFNKNKYVNLDNLIQKERNAKYVFIRSEGLEKQVDLKLAVNNHYLSGFYTKMFANILIFWLGIGFAAAISAYRSYGNEQVKSVGFTAKMIGFLFLVLNNFDQYKDLQYVVFLPHSLQDTVLFSLTITLSVFLNALLNKSLIPLLRNRQFDERGRKHPDYGMPLEVNEL